MPPGAGPLYRVVCSACRRVECVGIPEGARVRRVERVVNDGILAAGPLERGEAEAIACAHNLELHPPIRRNLSVVEQIKRGSSRPYATNLPK